MNNLSIDLFPSVYRTKKRNPGFSEKKAGFLYCVFHIRRDSQPLPDPFYARNYKLPFDLLSSDDQIW